MGAPSQDCRVFGSALILPCCDDPTESQRIFFVRVRGLDATVTSTVLGANGYTVLQVQ